MTYYGDSRPEDQAADAAMAALYRQLNNQDLPDDPAFDAEDGLRDLASRIHREHTESVHAEDLRRATEQDQGKQYPGSSSRLDARDAVGRPKHLHQVSTTGAPLPPQRKALAGGIAALAVATQVAVQEPVHDTPATIFGSPSAGPSVQRLVLGGHMRRLRERVLLTTEQAADAIRASRSKISRIEHGRVSFKERDIADLLTLYGVTNHAERQALLALAREANTPGWWSGYSDILPHWLEPYLGLEAAAAVLRTYEFQFVPGLLQTEDYARAVIRLGKAASEEDIARRTEARVARRALLDRENPPRIWAVVDEAALRRPIGGEHVMHGQIRYLIKMAEHPAVTLQVLPFSAGGHRALGGPFTILRFAEPGLRDVVYMEQLTSALYLDKTTEVNDYLEVMEQLCLQAEPVARTQDVLSSILKDC